MTGADSGIGKTIAVVFASQGAMVTLCGRDQNRLQATKELCVCASGDMTDDDRFIVVRGDIREPEIRKHIVDMTLWKFNRLDILVANAGVVSHDRGILNAAEETGGILVDTNVKAWFRLIQDAVPFLHTYKGNIVVVSSIESHVAAPDVTYYMPKAAVDHMVRSLAHELGPMGIRVNAVNPRFLTTRLHLESARMLNPAEAVYTLKANVDVSANHTRTESVKQHLGRDVIAFDRVAQAVGFLSSGKANSMTGQCLLVDAEPTLAGYENPYVSTQDVEKEEHNDGLWTWINKMSQ